MIMPGRFLLLLLLLAAPCRAWVSVEPPPDSRLAWVAEDMVHNGVPMRIQFFHSPATPGEVLDHYRRRWREGGAARYVENRLGPWMVIARAEGAFFVSVQVRPAATGAEGYLAQRALDAAPATLGQGVALPPGSAVANDILSRDAQRPARTLLLFNGLSVAANADFFRERYARDGWAVVSEGRARGGGQLVLQRGSEELSLAFSPSEGKTAIGATWVSK